MSVRGYPLWVRLDHPDGTSTRLTKQISDVSFRSADPGGFASGSFTLFRPLLAEQIPPFSQIVIGDSETGEIVGGGRVIMPGRTSGEDGEVWSIEFLGEGIAHTQDRTEPYGLISTQYEGFYTYRRTNNRAELAAGVPPNTDTPEGLLLSVDAGTFNIGSEIWAMDAWPAHCGQKLGAFNYRHIEGATSTDSRVEGIASNTSGGGALVRDEGWSTSLAAGALRVVGTHWTAGTSAAFSLRIRRLNTNATADDNTWAHVRELFTAAERLDRNGSVLTGASEYPGYVTADQVFTDVLARYCPRLDIGTASIATGTFQYNNLLWLDGVTPMQVLEDTLALEEGLSWFVWEQQANGKWRTEMKARPTAVRYEATVIDGFDAPAPATEVFNRVVVRGAKFGRPATSGYDGTSDVLTAAGLTRSTMVDLGDEIWTAAAASQAAARTLADSRVIPNGGTLTVARRIYDNFTGRWIKPTHIKPGELIRVRGVRPTVDTLNATDRNGYTVFRIADMEFSTSSGSATVGLDTYTPTMMREIARLSRARGRRR